MKVDEITKPEDIVKDPYVFGFFELPENKPMMESDLEKASLGKLKKFFRTRKRIYVCGNITKSNGREYLLLVDMVFYNKILKSYVLIKAMLICNML